MPVSNKCLNEQMSPDWGKLVREGFTGEMRLVAIAWKTADIRRPGDRRHWEVAFQAGDMAWMKRKKSNEWAYGLWTEHQPGSPLCRGLEKGSVRSPALSRALTPFCESFNCLLAFYSLGSSCHSRFKSQDLMSDITKVTFYVDWFALGTQGVFGGEMKRKGPEARTVRGKVFL